MSRRHRRDRGCGRFSQTSPATSGSSSGSKSEDTQSESSASASNG